MSIAQQAEAILRQQDRKPHHQFKSKPTPGDPSGVRCHVCGKGFNAPEHQGETSLVIGGDYPQEETDLSYDKELHYDLDKYPELQEQINRAERERTGKKSPNELVDELQRQFEANTDASKGQRWQGQQRWQGKENIAARLVRVINCDRFVERMRDVGVNVWLNSWSALGMIGLNARVPEKDPETGIERLANATLTSLQYPLGPEWSVMKFNSHDVPLYERYRGWRTALLVLILRGVVTEEQAEEAFGEPTGAPSLFYRRQLWAWRNEKYGEGLEWPENAGLRAGQVIVKPDAMPEVCGCAERVMPDRSKTVCLRCGHRIQLFTPEEEFSLFDTGRLVRMGSAPVDVWPGNKVMWPAYAGVKVVFAGRSQSVMMAERKLVARIQ